VDIDRILQQRDPLIPSPPAFVFHSTNALEGPSATDPIPALQSKAEAAHDVPSVTTFTTLIDSQSIPIDTPIIEFTPSNIINNEVLESIVVDHDHDT
ncbi:unnamed protein product, partial [Brassica oleracea]